MLPPSRPLVDDCRTRLVFSSRRQSERARGRRAIPSSLNDHRPLLPTRLPHISRGSTRIYRAHRTESILLSLSSAPSRFLSQRLSSSHASSSSSRRRLPPQHLLPFPLRVAAAKDPCPSSPSAPRLTNRRRRQQQQPPPPQASSRRPCPPYPPMAVNNRAAAASPSPRARPTTTTGPAAAAAIRGVRRRLSKAVVLVRDCRLLEERPGWPRTAATPPEGRLLRQRLPSSTLGEYHRPPSSCNFCQSRTPDRGASRILDAGLADDDADDETRLLAGKGEQAELVRTARSLSRCLSPITSSRTAVGGRFVPRYRTENEEADLLGLLERSGRKAG